jgi:hypothetical protein
VSVDQVTDTTKTETSRPQGGFFHERFAGRARLHNSVADRMLTAVAAGLSAALVHDLSIEDHQTCLRRKIS